MSRAKKTDWISYVIVEIPKEQGLGKKTSSGLQVPKKKKSKDRSLTALLLCKFCRNESVL